MYDVTSVRRIITKFVLSTRGSIIPNHNPQIPIVEASSPYIDEFGIYSRKRIVLYANGCSTPTCTMCPIPNESASAAHTVLYDDLIRQYDNSFISDNINKYRLVSIYNSGNWFANREISPEFRKYVYDSIRNSFCQGLIVESLPQFITKSLIAEAKLHLGDKRLIVGMGLQTSNELIRQICINTTCTLSQFEKATTLLRMYNFTPRVYLLLKPPFLTASEALSDICSSVEYLYNLDYRYVTICPMRVAPNTLVDTLYRYNLYSPPSLWLILNAIERIHSKIMVNISGLEVINPQNQKNTYPFSCKNCKNTAIRQIHEFNYVNNYQLLRNIHCPCQTDFIKNLISDENELPLLQRVSNFISRIDLH